MLPHALYPMLLEPTYKEVLWGGDRIARFKGNPTQQQMQGESWELSSLESYPSRIANGIYRGMSLSEVVRQCGTSLVGTGYDPSTDRAGYFPLLLKMIDAREDLSIQVHPTSGCRSLEQPHLYEGKSEMWYVLHADPHAKIYAGFRHKITPEIYRKAIQENSFETLLCSQEVRAGDVFYIPSGLVHAIGKGCLIFEIQQAVDLTYRIYDYGRTTPEGKLRPLHIEEALQTLDLSPAPSSHIAYQSEVNRLTPLLTTPFFEVSLLQIDQTFLHPADHQCGAYFVAEGSVEVSGTGFAPFTANQGHTFLIPYDMPRASFAIRPSGKARLIYSVLPQNTHP